jgi:GNAT superfamily N-acetyltransferase
LVLRTVRDERDVDRYAAFHSAYVSAAEGITCAYLLRHHPEIGYDDFIIVEDERTGELLSTTCLIPWHCCYEDIPLRVAMLEMVVTHPAHRHRGLIRAQIKPFHRRVSEQHYDLSVIEGIPYYYRQYGYAYAVDHGSYDSLPAWRIPDAPPGQDACEGPDSPGYVMRQATPDDAPDLVAFYRGAISGVAFHTGRDVAYWRFLLQHAHFPVRVVVDRREGSSVGYVACFPMGKAEGGTYVVESGIRDHETGMAVLRQLKAETGGEICLGWPQTNTLVQIARSLGSKPLPSYQWLVRITDIPAFLTKIGPVLERRLAAAGCGDLTADLTINLFREAYVLHFAAGQLTGAQRAGFVDSSMGADGGDLCIPPDAFVRLVCGYRDLDELRDAWPDTMIRPRSRRWLDVLFPKMTSYWCMPYLYNGPTG